MDKATAGKGYLTVEDAEEAIQRFCNDTGLPLPTHIVNSGRGLHVYWVLDRALDRDIWKASAEKFKALTNYLKFLVDGSRTADIASVLRFPGTLNYKYDLPRPVTQRYTSGKLIKQKSMLNAIDNAYNKLCCQSTVSSNTKTSKPNLTNLASALKVLDPDCDEATWKLDRIAPLARLAFEHPELHNRLYKLAKSYSSGELRGKASKAWTTPGKSNGLTGEEAFEQEWKRFVNSKYSGNPTTIATIYHDAKALGWRDTTSPKDTSATKCSNEGDDESLDPLATIQQQYGMINIGGKLYMFDRKKLEVSAGRLAHKLELSLPNDATLLIKRAVKAKFSKVDEKKISAQFFVSPNTTCYDGVEFNPLGASHNYLNLWVGPTIIPKFGKWKLIKYFLRDVI